ncbi:ubiquinol-cytochrome c reductase iron-sulfur subunit [Acidocella aromatica]|uniref:Ubiquinol-cytochrome c reductase iron-sulfur subunit n=1 Tax=Acidocella aromatica TaxID=1303579 RepID=A0A840VCA4_9PROT|nr:ubiquinol-cytochrome c reductase iron-sulfur subunit [Acidocella aromatica]MBB5373274.1 ubiquinol-cytochrome c reductase iron-sulfur subunit [Acidocella aromatica]
MAETAATEAFGQGTESRRGFLTILTGAASAVAAGAVLWPLVDALNPDAQSESRARMVVNVADIAENTAKTVQWNGLPIYIRKLTAQQIAAAQAVVTDTLPDPADFTARVNAAYQNYVVVVGLNTGITCALEGNDPSDPRGDYDGWLCPCDGSQYDALGRVRSGPATKNLAIPRFTFINAAQIRLG